MRVRVDFRSCKKENYNKFKKKYPDIGISYDEWLSIIYGFSEHLKNYILETGEKVKLPFGFGIFSVNKYRSKKVIKDINGIDRINLPVDWKKTKEKGKKIYNFNHHTDGYRFRWKWFKKTARLKFTNLWWFKPSRVTSRLLSHYIKTDKKYQHIYQQWDLKK